MDRAATMPTKGERSVYDQIETYFHTHSNANFTHSICPKCAKELYHDLEVHDDQRLGQICGLRGGE
jgi:hypothetical protein